MRYAYLSLLSFLLIVFGCDTVEETPPEPFLDATFVAGDSTVAFAGTPTLFEERVPFFPQETVTHRLDLEVAVGEAVLHFSLSHYSAGGFRSNTTYALPQEETDAAGMRCSLLALRAGMLAGTAPGTCTSLGFRWQDAGADSLALYLPISGDVAIDAATADEVSGTLAVTFDRVAVHAANRVILPPIPGFEPNDEREPINPQALTETVTLEASFTAIPRRLSDALR
ncbi:MAG: hypothetical protein GVY12_07080 [Bacteroidetes bacterium]|jgi:hypothetical protein|nr:hypothetical protein [Bacteroidota bacterium]